MPGRGSPRGARARVPSNPPNRRAARKRTGAILGLGAGRAGAARSVRPAARARNRRKRGEAGRAASACSRMAGSRALAAGRAGRMAGVARTRAARLARQRRAGNARGLARRISTAPSRRRSARGASAFRPTAEFRRPSRVSRGPGRGPGRRQPADRARLRSRRTATDSRSVRGRGRQGAGAGRGAPDATILATDSNRARLSKLPPRAERAGAKIETRLLNPPNELAELADWRGQGRPRPGRRAMLGQRDLAAQSGRPLAPDARAARPPGRAVQTRLLDIAAELVRPGGRLVYAVCSLLSREGAGQIDGLSQPPFIMDMCRKRRSPPGVGMVPDAAHSGPRRHRRIFRRAAWAPMLGQSVEVERLDAPSCLVSC